MEKNTVIGVQGGPLHSLINSASRFFTDIPPRVLEVNYWFYHISNLAYTLIALLHASWIWAFSAYGIYPMAQFQGISIVCYIFANVLNRKGYHVPGMILAVTEVIAHQILAASYLGWDCGFQNFLPLMSILPFLKYNRHLAVRLAFGITCLCAYVYMDAYLKHAVPLYALSPAGREFFSFTNAILCFFLAGLWGVVLAVSYQRTLAALMQKKQELHAIEKAAAERELQQRLEVKERDNEIYHLRNVALKTSNDEILKQKQQIEELVAEQEEVIALRTVELASANTRLQQTNEKLVELIQYNAHNMREPLTRIMGLVEIINDVTMEEFYAEVWPYLGKAASDLDNSIRNVIKVADAAITGEVIQPE